MGYKYCLFYVGNTPHMKIVGYYNSQEEMQQKLDCLPGDRQYFCQKYMRIPIPATYYHPPHVAISLQN